MKKLLLVGGLALGLGLTSTAQKFESREIGVSHQEVMVQDVKFPTNTAAESFGPKHVSGTVSTRAGQSVVDLGSFPNAFWLKSNSPRLIAEPKSKAVIFMHNGDNENTSSGDHFYSYSENETDWTTDNRIYVNDGDAYQGGNYVNPMIFNPEGSADLTKSYISYLTQNPTDLNGAWGGYAIGTVPMGETVEAVDGQEVIFEPDTDYFNTPITTNCVVGNKVFLVSGNMDYSSGIFSDQFIFIKGEFNETTKKVEYTRSLIDLPPGNYGETAGPYGTKIKFDEAGEVGYIFSAANAAQDVVENCWYPSFVMKTIDGGQNWTELQAFGYGGDDGLSALRGLITEEGWNSFYTNLLGEENPPPFVGDDNLKWENMWEIDGAVDAEGNLHLAMVLTLFYPSPDGTGYYKGVGGNSKPIVHLYTDTDSKGDITFKSDLVSIERCGVKTYEGDEGTSFAKVDLRSGIRVVPTADRKNLLFVWSDSEYILNADESNLNNDRPSIFVRGYQVANGSVPGQYVGESEATDDNRLKITHQTAADEKSFFFITTDILPQADGDNFKIPVLYGNFEEPTNPNLANKVSYHYLAGSTYNFSPNGLENTYVAAESNLSVKQNVPNPFNGTSEVFVNLVQKSELSLDVTNIAGQTVATYNKGMVEAGEKSFKIDATNLEAGIYFYTVSAGQNRVTKKMIVK